MKCWESQFGGMARQVRRHFSKDKNGETRRAFQAEKGRSPGGRGVSVFWGAEG